MAGRLTDAQYQALVNAYAAGVVTTRTADGWSVTYASMRDMYEAILAEERLRGLGGGTRQAISYLTFRSGTRPSFGGGGWWGCRWR